MTADPTRPLPAAVVEELRTQALRIKAADSAARLWQQVLTDEERQRLGGDLEALWHQRGTAGIWKWLRGVSTVRAVVEVAQALGFLTDVRARWLLREVGEAPADPEEAIAQAVASGALVLVAHPRAAYWRGQELAVDWGRRPALWDFFWEMARHAKAGQPVDHTTFATAKSVAVVAQQKSRLRGLRGFPRALGDLIQTVGRYTQQLNLPPQEIRLFELVAGETLREWKA